MDGRRSSAKCGFKAKPRDRMEKSRRRCLTQLTLRMTDDRGQATFVERAAASAEGVQKAGLIPKLPVVLQAVVRAWYPKLREP